MATNICAREMDMFWYVRVIANTEPNQLDSLIRSFDVSSVAKDLQSNPEPNQRS